MALNLPTAASLRLILGVDDTALPDLTADALIGDAALIAEQCSAIVKASDDKQAAVVKYVAGHTAALTLFPEKAGTVTAQKLGDGQDSYSSAPLGEQLGMTRFGQMAIQLDGTGCLKNLGKRKATLHLW